MTMTLREFHNGIRVLYSIDRHELVAAGVMTSTAAAEWNAFQADPVRWFIRADDATAERLWSIIVKRTASR